MTTKKEPKDSKMKEKPSSRCELLCEDMEKALYTVKDYFDRAMCPSVLMGETGHSVFYEEGLHGYELEIGVKPTNLTQYANSVLSNLIENFGTAPEPATFNIGTIPVKMYILRKDVDVFRYPDQKLYDMDPYMLPNPFVTYYKNREYFE